MRPKVMASPRRSSLAGREREYNRNRNGRYANPIQRRRVMSRVATSTDETPKPACFLSRNLRLAGSAVLLCLWWGSLHKALQLDLRSISLHAIAPWPFHDLALSGNTIAALSTALGIIGGCLLLFLACRRREGILRSRKAQQQLLLIEMILSALFYLAILIPVDTPKICSVLYGGVCACAVGNIAIIGGKLETFDNRQVVTVALFGLGADMILAPTFPPLFAHAPLLAAFFSLACVAGLALLNRRLDGGSCPSEKTTWIAELNRMPVFLAFTLFAYGFVFGAAEVLRGQLSDSSPFGCLSDISSTAIAVIVLTVLFYGRPASVELWSRLRGTVFPLALIGVALMPATAQGSLVVIGGSDLLFYAFLAAICVDVVQLTGIGIALIVANVLFWRALGAFTGMFAILLGGSLQSLSPEILFPPCRAHHCRPIRRDAVDRIRRADPQKLGTAAQARSQAVQRCRRSASLRSSCRHLSTHTSRDAVHHRFSPGASPGRDSGRRERNHSHRSRPHPARLWEARHPLNSRTPSALENSSPRRGEAHQVTLLGRSRAATRYRKLFSSITKSTFDQAVLIISCYC